MNEQPAYLLHAVPKGSVVIRDFFNAYGEVFSLLAQPPETRRGSFGMRMAATPQLRNGEYWELAANEPFHGRVRKLRVYADGGVIFRASADSSFLCWPKDTTARIVNPVVVADSIVSFSRLTREILAMMSVRPAEVQLGVEIRNAGQSVPPLMLYSGKLRKAMDYHLLDPGQLRAVGEMHPRRTVVIPTDKLLEADDSAPFLGADAAAYEVAKQFYTMFGYSDADVPYVNRQRERPRIDVHTFAS